MGEQRTQHRVGPEFAGSFKKILTLLHFEYCSHILERSTKNSPVARPGSTHLVAAYYYSAYSFAWDRGDGMIIPRRLISAPKWRARASLRLPMPLAAHTHLRNRGVDNC